MSVLYEQYFGFTRPPFDLTPNPACLVRTPAHREALSMLEYALSGGKGLSVLTGPAGTGKTTVLNAALQEFGRRGGQTASVNNPALSRDEFVEYLARAFELSEHAGASKSALVSELDALLRRRHEAGTPMALVVDEAQCLSLDLLEEIRLLGNIETSEQKLLAIVLAGQPELRQKLNDPALSQLKQRVALRCELAPFTLMQTASYIAARVRFAGGSRPPFTREAMTLIHRNAGGIPRTINVICDNALISAFAADQRIVGEETVREACRDLDLGTPSSSPQRPPQTSAAAPASGRPTALRTDEAPPTADAAETKPPAVREAPLFGSFAPRRRLWLFR